MRLSCAFCSHFMTMLWPCDVPAMCYFMDIALLLYRIKRTGAGVRKEVHCHIGKEGIQNQCRGEVSPLHDRKWYKGEREQEGREQKAVPCPFVWLFLQKTIYIIYLLIFLLSCLFVRLFLQKSIYTYSSISTLYTVTVYNIYSVKSFSLKKVRQPDR